MLSNEFLLGFKRETEEKWREKSIDPRIYGYQFQAGTRWNSGLSDECIMAYENAVGIHFSSDFKAFLRAMNGTDLPTLNIYGSSGEPSRECVGVYAYPKDLKIVQSCIAKVEEDRDTLVTTLAEQGFALLPTTSLIPIYMHRYVVCDSIKNCSIVLSIWDSKDAIVYAYTLQEYLEREFLGKSQAGSRDYSQQSKVT